MVSTAVAFKCVSRLPCLNCRSPFQPNVCWAAAEGQAGARQSHEKERKDGLICIVGDAERKILTMRLFAKTVELLCAKSHRRAPARGRAPFRGCLL